MDRNHSLKLAAWCYAELEALPTPARLREMAEALEQAHQDDLDHPDGPLEIGLDDMAAELRALADKLEEAK